MTNIAALPVRFPVTSGERLTISREAVGTRSMGSEEPISESRESLIRRSGLSIPMPDRVSADNAAESLWGEVRMPDGQTVRIYKSGVAALPDRVASKIDMEAFVNLPADPKHRAEYLLHTLGGGELRLADAHASARSTFAAQLLGNSVEMF